VGGNATRVLDNAVESEFAGEARLRASLLGLNRQFA
jgi:hypothetical protein